MDFVDNINKLFRAFMRGDEKMNDLVRLQMRKVGYDKQGKKGVAAADEAFYILNWFQDMYNLKLLDGKFYTDNIVKETWDISRKLDEPLNEILNAYKNLIEEANKVMYTGKSI